MVINWKSTLFVEAVVMYANIPSKCIMIAGTCLQQICPTLKGWHPVMRKGSKHIQTCSLRSWDVRPSYIYILKYICNHLHTSQKIWRKWHFLFTKYLAKEVITALQNQNSAQLVFQQFPPKEHSRSLCQKHWGGVGPYRIERGGVSCMMTNMMVLMWVYDRHTHANASAFWTLWDACYTVEGKIHFQHMLNSNVGFTSVKTKILTTDLTSFRIHTQCSEVMYRYVWSSIQSLWHGITDHCINVQLSQACRKVRWSAMLWPISHKNISYELQFW